MRATERSAALLGLEEMIMLEKYLPNNKNMDYQINCIAIDSAKFVK
jgi:hypothetical protein